MVSSFLFLLLLGNYHPIDSIKIDSIYVYSGIPKTGLTTVDAYCIFNVELKKKPKEKIKLSIEDCLKIEQILNKYKRKKHWQTKLGVESLFFEFYINDKIKYHNFILVVGTNSYYLIDLTKTFYQYRIDQSEDLKLFDKLFEKYY